MERDDASLLDGAGLELTPFGAFKAREGRAPIVPAQRVHGVQHGFVTKLAQTIRGDDAGRFGQDDGFLVFG